MATTQRYISHLLQNTGITPACSEEERAAADDIAHIFARHGFEPEVQEFSAKDTKKLATAILGIMAFVGALLCGIGGAVGIIGLLLAVAAAVIFTLERQGKQIISGLGASGLSQNVIAYHKATGPLASPRNRPVVIVAHYDSPRADVLSQEPYAQYRPMLMSFMPVAMLVPGIVAILRIFPFPDPFKIVLWLIAIVAALMPLANAVAIILNKFVLPYTTGSVCNKSSVAAMMGVMEAVSPYRGSNEFPHDIPADEYFAEQRRLAEEQRLAMEAALAAQYAEAEENAETAEPSEEESVESPVSGVEDESTSSGVDAAVAEVGGAAGVTSTTQVTTEAADFGATDVVETVAPDVTESMPPIAASDETTSIPAVSFETAEGVVAEEATKEASEEMFTTAESEPAVETEEMAAEQVDAVEEETVEPVAEEPTTPSLINDEGNIRFGEDVVRGLGMLPDSCVIEYEIPEPESESEPEEPEVPTVPSSSASPDATVVQPALTDDYIDTDHFDDIDSDNQDVYEPFNQPVYQESSYTANRSVQPHAKPRIPIRTPKQSPVAASGIAEAFATASTSASKFFGEAVRLGKEAISNIEAKIHTHDDESAPEIEEVPAEEATTKATVETETTIAPSEPEATETDDQLEKTVAVPALTDVQDATEIVVEGSGIKEASETCEAAEEVETVAAEDVVTTTAEEDATEMVSDEAESSIELTEEPLDQTVEASVGEDDPTEVVAANRSADPSATIIAPPPEPLQTARPTETVDSLMAEITGAATPTQPSQRRQIVVPDPSQPSIHEPTPINRASLFDLPDPSAAPSDPFAAYDDENAENISTSTPTSQSNFTVINGDSAQQSTFDTITSDTPITTSTPEAPRHRGLGGLFHHKKSQEQSMSDYLGVSDSFDAKNSGREIGSWDNFEDFDDDDWKGGAAGIDGVTEDELRDAITSMGDDELLGHDIWFVATGASEFDHAGIKAFLSTHRDKLRGVFFINLECVGSGQVAMLATEGDRRVLKGDKRIMNLVSKVSSAFHHELGAIEMPYLSTDAYAAMDMSLRSLTIAGIDGPKLACSHSEEDVPFNVDVDNINMVADIVTEVIRRS